MRWPIALSLMISVFPTARLAADDYPYKAIVKQPDTQVRSGPGKNYYATDKLDEGATVEVYRHDPGGWAAIRPPDGSFSWVRTRYLKINPDQLASVQGHDVVARVGSSLTETRDVIQVHLEDGEIVELVDSDESRHGTWRKIAPPAGEFRWVPTKSIERMADPPHLTDTDDKFPPADAASVIQADYQDDGASLLVSGEESPVIEDEEPQPRSRRRRLSHTALQQEIVDIDLELSTRLSAELEAWAFDDLKERAEEAMQLAPTALDRAAVRELIAKIDRFDHVGRRNEEVQVARLQSQRNNRLAMETSLPPIVDGAPSRFDGVGKLARVVSKQPNSPEFALIDSTGAVRYYINPAPGVNLKPYLNKQVGINGTRGAVAARQQIISAQRIAELPTETRRY